MGDSFGLDDGVVAQDEDVLFGTICGDNMGGDGGLIG